MSIIRHAHVCLAVACVHVALAWGSEAAEPGAQAQPPGERQTLITISKETTHIVRPLDDEGYIDYVAALNERCSRGVTPENNAMVPFWRAMGPQQIDPEIRERFFAMLGIPPLPVEGEYFRSFAEHLEDRGLEENEAVLDRFNGCLQGPWSREDAPAVGAWLAANEKPLALLLEASRRPRCYAPLVTGDPRTPCISVLLPGLGRVRSAGRLLAARAMLRLDSGDVDGACGDLVACHRLGRLVGQGPTLIDGLVSITVDAMASQADAAVAQSGKLSAEQAAAFLAELDKLAPLPKMVDKIDVSERYMFLDCVAAVAREGPALIASLDGPDDSSDFTKQLAKSLTNSTVDWNAILRRANGWYDRLVEAGRKPTLAERRQALSAFDEDLQQMLDAAGDKKSMFLDLFTGRSPQELLTDRMGDLLLALLMPALGAAASAQERAEMRLQVTRVALALAAYHAERGTFPARLADLAPKHLAKVPRDCFADAELVYRRTDDGYLLYSLGPNGEDDGGRNWRLDPRPDDAELEDWDDIAVRK